MIALLVLAAAIPAICLVVLACRPARSRAQSAAVARDAACRWQEGAAERIERAAAVGPATETGASRLVGTVGA